MHGMKLHAKGWIWGGSWRTYLQENSLEHRNLWIQLVHHARSQASWLCPSGATSEGKTDCSVVLQKCQKQIKLWGRIVQSHCVSLTYT